MKGPPPDKGASAGPRGRAWAARGSGPSLNARPSGPCASGTLAEAACVEPAMRAAASGGLCPARYASGRRRCLIFLRRETCSAPRPPRPLQDTPTLRPTPLSMPP